MIVMGNGNVFRLKYWSVPEALRGYDSITNPFVFNRIARPETRRNFC
jgi:hypothetical protein